MSAVASRRSSTLLNVEEGRGLFRRSTSHMTTTPPNLAAQRLMTSHMSMRRRVEAAREYRCTHVSCTPSLPAPCFTYTAPGPA